MGIIICLSQFYLSVRPTLVVFVIKISVDCNVWRNYLIFIPSFKIIWKITLQSTARSVNGHGQPYRELLRIIQIEKHEAGKVNALIILYTVITFLDKNQTFHPTNDNYFWFYCLHLY